MHWSRDCWKGEDGVQVLYLNEDGGEEEKKTRSPHLQQKRRKAQGWRVLDYLPLSRSLSPAESTGGAKSVA